MKEKQKFDYGTLREALAKWNNKESVWSVEMGGLGPGYEQCIQVMVFEMCKVCIDKEVTPDNFETMTEPVISELNNRFGGGFSGAQVGAARQVAYKFLTKGYNECLHDEAIQDRKIQVSNCWEYKK